MTRTYIPKMDEETIQARYQQMRPLVRKHGLLWSIHPDDNITTISYTWNARIARPVVGPLQEICVVRTFHEYGAPALFKPSIREVLSQLPESAFCKQRRFFHLQAFDYPESHDQHAWQAGYHTASVTVYSARLANGRGDETWKILTEQIDDAQKRYAMAAHAILDVRARLRTPDGTEGWSDDGKSIITDHRAAALARLDEFYADMKNLDAK